MGGVNIKQLEIKANKTRTLLALNIRYFRQKPNINLSQQELADKVNSTRKYISDIETCKSAAGTDLIDRITIALGIEPYELFMPRDFSNLKSRIDARD